MWNPDSDQEDMLISGHVGLFFAIAMSHFLALLSPGPDFVLLIRTSVTNSTRDGLYTALGIASANALYIGLCLAGLASALSRSPWAMKMLQIIGGGFLAYLAFRSLLAKKADYTNASGNPQKRSLETSKHQAAIGHWLTGFLSGVSNPKNILFYLSLFSLSIANSTGLGFQIAIGVWMTVAVILWDALVVLLVSRPAHKKHMNKAAFFIDKVAGVMFALLAIRVFAGLL